MKIDITDWQDEQLEVVPAVEEKFPSFEVLWSMVPEYEKIAYYDDDINTYIHYLMVGRSH
jgi:hypothetical protein